VARLTLPASKSFSQMSDRVQPAMEAAVRDRIRDLLLNSLLVPADHLDSDLVATGVIDSADFMALFMLLEREFGIEIQAGDLVLENFRTIARMTSFVRSKTAMA
jgi:acyl carrier protein